MSELNYLANGDYLIPDLTSPQTDVLPPGKYGRMRQAYLRENRPILFNSLILSGELMPHLREIDWAANQRMEQMMTAQAQAQGLTEELKATDPMRWVGLMNNLKAQAEETILAELINA